LTADVCKLQGTEHAKLLDRIKVDRSKCVTLVLSERLSHWSNVLQFDFTSHSKHVHANSDIGFAKKPVPGIRIFCGIYTTEKQHEGNVKVRLNL